MLVYNTTLVKCTIIKLIKTLSIEVTGFASIIMTITFVGTNKVILFPSVFNNYKLDWFTWDNSCLLNERTEGELDTGEGRKFHIRICMVCGLNE